jgi:hypothetical protein
MAVFSTSWAVQSVPLAGNLLMPSLEVSTHWNCHLIDPAAAELKLAASKGAFDGFACCLHLAIISCGLTFRLEPHTGSTILEDILVVEVIYALPIVLDD